jgi:hypothetical protein
MRTDAKAAELPHKASCSPRETLATLELPPVRFTTAGMPVCASGWASDRGEPGSTIGTARTVTYLASEGRTSIEVQNRVVSSVIQAGDAATRCRPLNTPLSFLKFGKRQLKL